MMTIVYQKCDPFSLSLLFSLLVNKNKELRDNVMKFLSFATKVPTLSTIPTTIDETKSFRTHCALVRSQK